MVFRGGAFGRKLGLYEVMRMGLVPLQEETQRAYSCSLPSIRHSQKVTTCLLHQNLTTLESPFPTFSH